MGGLIARFTRDERGSAMIEYGLMAALIALGLVLTMELVGETLRDQFNDIADPCADFVYARLQRSREDEPTGYGAADLDRWAEAARGWARGEAPAGLDYVAAPPPPTTARDVFAYFISGAKVHNPAAAMALIERLGPA